MWAGTSRARLLAVHTRQALRVTGLCRRGWALADRWTRPISRLRQPTRLPPGGRGAPAHTASPAAWLGGAYLSVCLRLPRSAPEACWREIARARAPSLLSH